MRKQRGRGEGREEFGKKAEGMYERVREWREEHPEAKFDEIARIAGEERKRLMGGLLSELAMGYKYVDAPEFCRECGGKLEVKGEKKRGILHREGEAIIQREHYYCPNCEDGIFPPGRAIGIDQT